MSLTPQSHTIFISYSHKDATHKDALVKHLKALGITGHHNTWADDQIPTGTDWDQTIKAQMQGCALAVFLLSPALLSSQYIQREEKPVLLQRHRAEGLPIHILTLEPTPLDNEGELAKLQAALFDTGLKHLANDLARDEAIMAFAQDINRALKARQAATSGNAQTVKSPAYPQAPKPPKQVMGRGGLVQEVHQRLTASNRNTLLLVNGVGGMGKTTVALHYWHSPMAQGHYQHRTWVTVPDGEEADQAVLSQLGPLFDTPMGDFDAGYQHLLQHLAKQPGPNLLVLDNANTLPNLDALEACGWHIVLTTRAQVGHRSHQTITVEALDEAAAHTLFYHWYTRQQDNAVLNGLLQTIGHHTLLIEMLAQAAQERGLSLEALAEKLKEAKVITNPDLQGPIYLEHKRLREAQAGGALTRHEADRLTTIDQYLPTLYRAKELPEAQQHWLRYFCLLPPQAETVERLQVFFGASEVPDFWQQLRALATAGWLLASELEEGKGYRMHPVVATLVRHQLAPSAKQAEPMLDYFSRALYYEGTDNPLSRIGYTLYGAHMLQHLPHNHTSCATLANKLALVYLNLGQYAQALEFGLKSLDIRERILAADHADLAVSYLTLSQIYRNLGQYEQALEFGLKSLDIRERILAADHPDLAVNYGTLSQIYRNLGQYEQALEFGLKSLDIRERILASDHPSLAGSYLTLSHCYDNLGQYEQALEFGLKSLDIRERTLASDHPSLAVSYYTLSQIYQSMGQLQDALDWGQKALQLFEQVLDPLHPSLGYTYNHMGGLYKALGNVPQAKAFAEKAMALREKALPTNHPDLAASRELLASLEKGF